MAVTTTLAPFPNPAPNIQTQSQEVFSQNADSAFSHLITEFPDINAVGDEINSTAVEVNDNAVIASQKATITTDQATIATDEATASAASAASALSSLNEFKGQYYGSLASEPTTDPLGNAMGKGDLYYNSTTNEINSFDGVVWSVPKFGATAGFRNEEFTATAGQTVFTVAGGYSPESASVFKNGAKLLAADVDLSSGTTFTLATADAVAGDKFEFLGFGSFDVVNEVNLQTVVDNIVDIQNAEENATSATGSAATAAGYADVLAYNFESIVKPTINLNFARQEYSIYEIPYGKTEKPLIDIVDVIRASTSKYTDPTGLVRTADVNVPRNTYDPVIGEPNGLLVEESRNNLVTYPRDFINPAWFKTRISIIPNSTIAPDGSISASSMLESLTGDGAGYLYRGGTVFTAGTNYAVSVYVKKIPSVIGGKIRVQLSSSFGFDIDYPICDFDLDTSTVTLGRNHIVEAFPDSWYRLSVYGLNTGGYTGNVILFQNQSGDTAGQGCYIWDAQLEEGSFPTSTIPDATIFNSRATPKSVYDSTGTLVEVGVDVAPYTYNPANLRAEPVLLLEEERTNEQLYSKDLLTGYSYSRSTVAVSTQPSKLSGEFMTKWLETVDAGGSYIYQNKTFTAGNTYTVSIDIKQLKGQALRLGLPSSLGFTGADATFDPSTGVVSGANPEKARMQYLGDGIYRCSVTDTCLTTTTANWIFATMDEDYQDITYGLYIANLQCEIGAYPTSYIATTTTQGTRSADLSTGVQATRSADYPTRVFGNELDTANYSIYVRVGSDKFYTDGTSAYLNGVATTSDFAGFTWNAMQTSLSFATGYTYAEYKAYPKALSSAECLALTS